jgi:cation:H+ antiporter
MIYLYFVALIISFAILFKSADFFIKGASGIAKALDIPKLIVGIVLVGMATTAPEFGASVIAAFRKHSEIALGNAIGSVICDDGIALGLAAILAPTAILVNCKILKSVGIFLLSIDIFAYLLARNGTIGRAEGMVFLVILCIYFIVIIRSQRASLKFKKQDTGHESEISRNLNTAKKALLKRSAYYFLGGLTGVFITCWVVVEASIQIARYFSISEVIIGSTIIAIGTSLPEISTCITAALKGEGEIAVGDILGADILNILWIIGFASVVNPIKVEVDIINFLFPFMILIVVVMLVSMRIGCRLGKAKGFVLLGLYLVYITLNLIFFT